MKKVNRIFFHQTSFNEKLLIIHIALIYAICSSCFIGISVWFKQPELTCQTKSLSHSAPSACTEDQACHNPKVTYQINTETGPNTLAAELGIVCEHKFLKRMLLSAGFFGGFLGCLMNTLIYVPANKRKAALAILCLILVFAKLGVLFSAPNNYLVGFFLALISFCSIIINSYCFAIINDVFTGEVSKVATVIMTLAWGLFGVYFGGFCFLVNANWKIIFTLNAGLMFSVAMSLLLLKNEKGVKASSSQEPTSLISFIKDIWKSPQEVRNFLIFLTFWVATSLTYNDVLLELEHVGQNIFVNMTLLALIEMIASFISGYLVLNFNIMMCLRGLLSFSFTMYMSFYFSPRSSDHPLLFVVFLTCKLFSEIILNLVNIHGPKIIAEKYVSFFFIFARLMSRVMLLFLPHINYGFQYVGIHPFVFLSLIYGFSRFLINSTKEPLVTQKNTHPHQKVETPANEPKYQELPGE